MKKKTVNKIASAILKQTRDYRNEPIQETRESMEWAEHDPEVSNRFKKMIHNLLNYRENVRLQIYETSFCLSTDDLSTIKVKKPYNSVHSEEDHLRIDVSKEGFTITKGYSKRSNYLDDKIFDELIDQVRMSQKKYNSENFLEIWNHIMKDSGMSRDNNLNELFDGK